MVARPFGFSLRCPDRGLDGLTAIVSVSAALDRATDFVRAARGTWCLRPQLRACRYRDGMDVVLWGISALRLYRIPPWLRRDLAARFARAYLLHRPSTVDQLAVDLIGRPVHVMVRERAARWSLKHAKCHLWSADLPAGAVEECGPYLKRSSGHKETAPPAFKETAPPAFTDKRGCSRETCDLRTKGAVQGKPAWIKNAAQATGLP